MSDVRTENTFEPVMVVSLVEQGLSQGKHG